MRKHKAFEISLDLNASLPVTINTQELQQVIVNLISNGVHAPPTRGGEIRLSTQNWEDKGVCVQVTDNGSGLSPDQRSRIFNPFYSTKPEGKGTGLGLSVSYGLIRRYGGNITVMSTPGVGSQFKVWLLSQPQLIEDAETIAEQLHDAETHDQPADPQLLRDASNG